MKRSFNFRLLSRCCWDNYMLEQPNNYLYTYSYVRGVAHWIPSKSYSRVSRITIKMLNLEPRVSATCIRFFQLDMKWSCQESSDVRAEFLLSFLLKWPSSTTDFYHVLNQVSLATKKESAPLKDLLFTFTLTSEENFRKCTLIETGHLFCIMMLLKYICI